MIVFIQSVYRPHTSVLGTEQGVDGHHGIAPGGDMQIVPGMIVYGFDAPLFFANAPYLMDQVGDLISAADPPITYFLIDAEAIPDIDTTAADTLKEIYNRPPRERYHPGYSEGKQTFARNHAARRPGGSHRYSPIFTRPSEPQSKRIRSDPLQRSNRIW